MSILFKSRKHNHGTNFSGVQDVEQVRNSGGHWILCDDIRLLVLVALTILNTMNVVRYSCMFILFIVNLHEQTQHEYSQESHPLGSREIYQLYRQESDAACAKKAINLPVQ